MLGSVISVDHGTIPSQGLSAPLQYLDLRRPPEVPAVCMALVVQNSNAAPYRDNSSTAGKSGKQLKGFIALQEDVAEAAALVETLRPSFQMAINKANTQP